MDKTLIENVSFSSLTTLKIGGPIKYFATATSLDQIFQLIEISKKNKLSYLVIGGGSNLLVSDGGLDGLVIQNLCQSIKRVGDVLEVQSGRELQRLVDFANKAGIAGFEKLAGIPGSVGGAVYGNAGAYGQTISDNILWVEIYDTVNREIKKLTKNNCGFDYRHSNFKIDKNIILDVGFSITLEDSDELVKTSQEIIKARMQKYHPNLACPGSFFKNVEVDKLDKLDKIILKDFPEDKVMFGKISAGWLLEMVGAKGARKNGVEIAPWHGNLFINLGGGKAVDFLYLAKKYKDKVREKFGIELEPEVQLVGFNNNPL